MFFIQERPIKIKYIANLTINGCCLGRGNVEPEIKINIYLKG